MNQSPTQSQTIQFAEEVNNQLTDIIPTIQTELSVISPTLTDDLTNTINVAGAAVYDEFISLLETTKNSSTFDRLQSTELDVLIEQAVMNAFTNNNLGLFVQGKIQLI
jgi:hypothetical protein